MLIKKSRIALFIDADNISAKYISIIFNNLEQYGSIIYKRAYSDWSRKTDWNEIFKQYALLAIQQHTNASAKNASDIAIVIDVMDILYKNDVDIFCLVSSDSDFTRLAIRLQEAGKYVIVMGEEKTPLSLQNACHKFEQLGDRTTTLNVEVEQVKGNDNEKIEDISEIKKLVIKFLTEAEQQQMNAGEIGKKIQEILPNFNYKNYGFGKISTFLANFPEIILLNNNRVACLKINKLTPEAEKEKIEKIIIELINQSPQRKIPLSTLNNELVKLDKNFNFKKHSSKFISFIQLLKKIKIESSGNNGSVKHLVLAK